MLSLKNIEGAGEHWRKGEDGERDVWHRERPKGGAGADISLCSYQEPAELLG